LYKFLAARGAKSKADLWWYPDLAALAQDKRASEELMDRLHHFDWINFETTSTFPNKWSFNRGVFEWTCPKEVHFEALRREYRANEKSGPRSRLRREYRANEKSGPRSSFSQTRRYTSHR